MQFSFRYLTLCAAIGATALGLVTSARADITLSLDTGEVHLKQLANNGYPSDFDLLDLNAVSSTITLANGVATPVTVNNLVFTVGYSSYGVYTSTNSISWALALGGTTQTVSETLVVGSSTGANGGDNVSLSGGPTLTYGFGIRGSVDVTPGAFQIEQTAFGPVSYARQATMTYHALALSDQIQEIIEDVQEDVAAGQPIPSSGQPLYAKLNAALGYLAHGDTADAKSVLQAFINQVKALVKTGRLDAASGQHLIDDATYVISEL
jgi:hypothetical protein